MDPSERPEDSVTEAKIDAQGVAAAGSGGTPRSAGRRPHARIRTALAAVLITAALLLGLLRFGFPLIENHRAEVEGWVSDLLRRPVSIDSLHAYWRGWSPELEIHGLALHRAGEEAAGSQAAITFDRVRISVDPVESLKSRRLLAHAVVIEGASLTVKRDPDGSIHIAGMQPLDASDPGRAPEDLARWMMKEGTLIFDATTVSWVDARRDGAPVLLTSAGIEFSNVGNNHRLSGSFRIPGISDQRIQVALDASGDLSTSEWSGQMLVSANEVHASRLGALFDASDQWVTGGTSDLSVWTRWTRGEMEWARLKIHADGLMLSQQLGGLRVHGGSAEVQIGRLDNGWSAAMVLSDIHTSEGRWRSSRGTLNYVTDANSKQPRLVGRFEYARLADLATLMQSRLKSIDFASAALETYRPNADLNNVHFSIGLGPENAGSLVMSADFKQLTAFVGPAFPAISGYSGRIEIDGDAGVVAMDGGNVDFALSEVFDGRFPLKTRGGRFAWQQLPEGLRLDVYDVAVEAAGFDARVGGFARFDGDSAGPLLNLVANINSEDVGELRRYIPGGVLKPKLTNWLQQAVVGGRVTDGQLLLHGRLADFPFDQEDGVLEARFAVEDGELQYGKGWPGLSRLSGELRIRGRRLDATIASGRVLDSAIDATTIVIDRLGQGVPVVQIQGSARGRAAEGIRFLSESPLNERISNHVRNVAIAGDVDLNLEIDIPLDKSAIRVDGRVKLLGNRLDFPHLRSGLEQVKGTLHFTRRGAIAKSIDAVYLERPVKIDVATRPKPPHDTRVQIAGRADSRFIALHLFNSGLLDDAKGARSRWLQRVDGETDWTASIEVPAAEPGANKNPAIRLKSNLAGLSIDLPYPAGKDAATPRALSIYTEAAGGKHRRVNLSYGEDARAALELEAKNGSQAIVRGGVHLGGGEAALPDGDGIRVGGTLSRLSVGEWVHAWESAIAPAGVEPPPQSRLRMVALDVGRLVLLGSGFEQVRIDAHRNDEGSWNTRFDGPGLKGTVRLLKNGEENTLLASFDEIDYRSVQGKNGTRVADPGEFPAVRLMSERFIFNGRDLGLVELNATPSEAGLNFNNISIESPHFEARANGFWHHRNEQHHSEFSVSVHSEKLGGFLQSMGFGGTDTAGGVTDVFLNARWGASPMEFDLARLNGALHFRSTGGRFLSVKRGATQRIFGLLSVTTLPQRLILDFTDLFEQGLSYNSIEGSFNLANGQAYTNNLLMETDTARVEIAGRTGLVAEDYDQIMTVTPKLTSSLPLAPLWLAEKAFNSNIFGKTFAAQYTITGSWSDPKIEPIQVEANPAEKG